MNKSLYLVILIFAVLVFGCASTKQMKAVPSEEPKAAVQEAATPQEAASEDLAKKQQDQGLYQELTLPEFQKIPKPKPLPPKEPIDPRRLVHVESPVVINAEAMPLSDFIVYALGDILKVTFFIDEPVKNMKNPVTLRMTQEMPPDKVMEIVIGFLEKYDLIVEEKAGALYITKTRPQTQRPVDIRIGRDVQDSPAEIVQIVTFKHVRAQEVEGIIREIYKTGVNIKFYYRENAMLLSGPASSIREVVNLINIFDVPYMQSKKLFMLRFTYWQTDDFIKQLTTILEGLGFAIARMPKDAGILFIPIKALNSVLVVAPDDESMKYILQWHKRLDTPESAGTEEKAFTYTPRYSKASDLVDSLKRLYTVAQPAAPSPQPAAPAPKPQPAAPGQSAFSITGLKIAADDRRNIVLISASPSQYKAILNYLESLDAPPRQVLLEATIAELTLKDDLKYGLEWYLKSRMNVDSNKGDYTLSTLGKLGVGSGSGLVYQFVSDTQKIQAILNAFAQENRINILSSPRLMVIDNQEASLQIGTDVPIITGETKTTTPETGTTIATQSVQYRSTGLIVKVKPNINTEGMLTLEISLESSEAQQNTVSAVSSPIILTRNLKTNVVAATQQTIILGGIMSENISDTETKIPLFGDIPLLGNLFKNTSKSKTKTELIIMIRPVIITTAEDAVKLTGEIMKGFKWLR